MREMMQYIRVALLISLSIFARAQQLDAYRQHEAFLKEYPCGAPQPRVFELEDVIGVDVLKEKTNGNIRSVKPFVTVLHRCYSSGCCKNSVEKCMPSQEEDVKLTFLITSGPTLSYLEVDAVNHTQCACTSA